MRLAVFALLALVGCAYGPADDGRQTDYRWSFTGTPEARVAFAEALAEWNACGLADGHLLPIGDGSGIHVQEGTPEGDAVAETGIVARRPIGILYRPHPRLRYAFAHELGHAMRGTGEHTQGGLMNPRLLHEEPSVDCGWIE